MGDKQLFVVRVWQHMSEFRASVRAPGDSEPQLFTEPGQVGDFLNAAVATSSTQPEGDRHDEAV